MRSPERVDIAVSTVIGLSSWMTQTTGCRRAVIAEKDKIHGIDAADGKSEHTKSMTYGTSRKGTDDEGYQN